MEQPTCIHSPITYHRQFLKWYTDIIPGLISFAERVSPKPEEEETKKLYSVNKKQESLEQSLECRIIPENKISH